MTGQYGNIYSEKSGRSLGEGYYVDKILIL